MKVPMQKPKSAIKNIRKKSDEQLERAEKHFAKLVLGGPQSFNPYYTRYYEKVLEEISRREKAAKKAA